MVLLRGLFKTLFQTFFAKLITGKILLSISAKYSILDVSQVSDCTSVDFLVSNILPDWSSLITSAEIGGIFRIPAN